jgi:uncharacterized protein YbjT (DUF2867 family)
MLEERISQHPRVVVVGASGYVGTNLVPRLLAEGWKVRAVARNRKVLEAREWAGAELAEADVLSPDTLVPVLRGMDIAYYLVHSMNGGSAFGRLDEQGAENFAKAAATAGIKRIVYLGGLVPHGADSEHLVSRGRTGERLRSGSVPVTELRAGIIVGAGSAAFEVIRDLVNHLPLMVTPRWVRKRSPPIALDNVLEYLVRLPVLEEATGDIYEAGGPEMLTYEQLMHQFGERVGKHPRIIPVPILSPRLSAYWLRLITAVPTNIARALIEGLRFDIEANDRELRRLVPQRLLTYAEAVEAVFDAERRNVVAARWTEGVLLFRDSNPRYAFYAKRASGSAIAQASPAAVWNQVASIGGAHRYYYLNLLWTLREAADWAVGGPGLSRGRRHPAEVRVGDAIDSWRVVGLESGRRLTLAFGMKAPGGGVLELEVEELATDRTRVTATAYWHPAGMWGLVYWYFFAPWHRLLFNGMTRAMVRRAEDYEDAAPPVARGG